MDVPSSRPSKLLLVSNVVGYVVLIAVNVASGAGLFGADNATISKKFHTPLTPAGWAFSIWGFIFLTQGLGTIYALLPHGYTSDGSKQRVVNAIGYRWQLGWYAECAWQLSFAQESIIGMWLCLAFLLMGLAAFFWAMRRLSLLRDDFTVPQHATLLYVSYLLPSSVNSAWLSVASCLGALVVGRSYGMEEQDLLLPSVVLAVLVTVAGAWYVLSSRDTAYGLTLVWSLLAVFGKSTQLPVMRWVAFAAVLVMSVVSMASLLRRKPPSVRVPEGERLLRG